MSQPAPLASSAGTRYKVNTGFTNIDHVSGGVYCNVSGEIVTLEPPPS